MVFLSAKYAYFMQKRPPQARIFLALSLQASWLYGFSPSGCPFALPLPGQSCLCAENGAGSKTCPIIRGIPKDTTLLPKLTAPAQQRHPAQPQQGHRERLGRNGEIHPGTIRATILIGTPIDDHIQNITSR